ncbi:MAG: sigma-70 family RNA polymerase sigma factor [Oscillospiraceae bacterium]|nr:sigma-70 family RNA polymerase sigma factor [Oscillospiraceae bacterium]
MDERQRQQIETLYLQMFDQLMAYAKATLQDSAMAEEAVQDTFRIACQRPDQLCDSPSPPGWLILALRNTIRNLLRRQEKAKRALEPYLQIQSEQPTWTKDRLRLKTLYEDVADTPEFQLLWDQVVEGKTFHEMALERGISTAACRKRVQRAKEILKNKLDQDFL